MVVGTIFGEIFGHGGPGGQFSIFSHFHVKFYLETKNSHNFGLGWRRKTCLTILESSRRNKVKIFFEIFQNIFSFPSYGAQQVWHILVNPRNTSILNFFIFSHNVQTTQTVVPMYDKWMAQAILATKT